MGRASKLKKAMKAINSGNYTGEISNTVFKKIERQVRRLDGTAKGSKGQLYKIPLYKEYPCQKDSRYKVFLLAEVATYKKDDGLLYFMNGDKEELVTSLEWKAEQARIEHKKELEAKRAKEQAVTQLKPTILGND